jgi:hypothetical protein
MASLSELASVMQTSPAQAFRQEDIAAQQYGLQSQALQQAKQEMAPQQPLASMAGGIGAGGKPQAGLGAMANNMLGPQYKLTTPDGELTSAGLVNQTLITAQTDQQNAQAKAKEAQYLKAMGKDKEAQVADMEARRYLNNAQRTQQEAQKLKTDAKDDFASTLYGAKSQVDYDRRLKDALERTGIEPPKDFPTTWSPDMRDKLLSKMSPVMRQKIEAQDRSEAAADRAEKRSELQNQHLVALIRNGQGSGKESPQATRVIQAFTQTADALQNVANLPITTGPLFQQKQFGSLYTAPLSALNQTLSNDTSQMLQTRMTGVARGLAALESGGAATGLVGLTDSIEKGVFIPAGASLGVTLDKLGEMRRIVESSGKAQLNDPKLSSERKALIQQELDIVRTAIPFTQSDVDKAMKASKKNPNISFTEFATQKPIGEGPIDSKAVKSKEVPTVTTKEQFDALPSGSEFIEDGKKYRKP